MPEMKKIKSGERLSFFGLFAEKELIIEIPIIQRDYAQGRKSSQNVRGRFLDALKSYLEENIPGRDLDFVYGSIKKTDAGDVFIPLDGQQRLTTLYLLHWYLSLIGNSKESFKDYLGYNQRSRFTYETRTSAREFCDALVLQSFTYEEPIEGRNISQRIKNTHWYYLSWDMDPTIQSMLVMLDEIEAKFHKSPEYYDRLTNLENPIITFQFLNLKEFSLTDDLYIKMNSRGKPLTPFENFKAKIEQEIKRLFIDELDEFEITTNNITRKVSGHDYFSNRIDTVWLDYFWKAGGNKPKLIDGQMMNFIRVTLANHLAIRSFERITLEAAQRPFNFRVLIDSQDARKKANTENLTFFDFLEHGAISKDSIKFLIKSFDIISKIDFSVIRENINPLHFDYDSIIKKAFDNSLTAQERVKLHAFITYFFQDNNYDLGGLWQWMRVVHNLAENHRIDDADLMISALQGVNQMSVNSHDILTYLKSKKSVVGGFYSRQIEEEKIKAKLISRSDEWKKLIHSLEDSSFFIGQIGFLLEFSGIIEEYLRPGSFDWDQEEEKEFFFKFSDYASKALAIFSEINSSKNKNFLWERTVLCKGNYLRKASYNRYNFLHSSANTRDYSWKRLLRLNRDSDGDNLELTLKRNYIKDVFDDLRFKSEDAWASCNEIVNDVTTDWRNYFIKNPELIRVCGHGFIRIDNTESIKLQTKTKLTYYYEFKTYNLFLTKVRDFLFVPFQSPEYWWAYGDDGICYIFLGLWNYKKKEYHLKIYYEVEYGFGIEFCKAKGSREEVQYSDDVNIILLKQGYKFDLVDWSGFYKTAKTEKSVMNIINELCNELEQLS